jgi:glycerol-3-phosphate acyltransferase PlsY
MDLVYSLLATLVAYCIGSLSFAVIVSKLMCHQCAAHGQ